MDLSEPVLQTQNKAKKSENPSRSEGLKASTHRKKTENPDLISVDSEQKVQAVRVADKSSLDLGKSVALLSVLHSPAQHEFLLATITK